MVVVDPICAYIKSINQGVLSVEAHRGVSMELPGQSVRSVPSLVMDTCVNMVARDPVVDLVEALTTVSTMYRRPSADTDVEDPRYANMDDINTSVKTVAALNYANMKSRGTRVLTVTTGFVSVVRSKRLLPWMPCVRHVYPESMGLP